MADLDPGKLRLAAQDLRSEAAGADTEAMASRFRDHATAFDAEADRLTVGRDSRNWDRSPETAKDKRFHDLRDSGYRGPIDQDGHAVTDGPDAAALKRMAELRGEDTSWWTGGAEHGGEADASHARDSRVLEANRRLDPEDHSGRAQAIRQASIGVRDRQVQETEQRWAARQSEAVDGDEDGLNP